MITRKLKPCRTCNDPSYIFSHGNCKRCSQLAKIAEKREFKPLVQTEYGRPGKPFKVYNAPKVSKKKNLTADQINDKNRLNAFFESQEVPERCENCNQKLNAFNLWAKRCVSAHILPKEGEHNFPSVATHPDNIMFLGKGIFSECNCHDLWDWRNSADRKKMPCYKIAIERTAKFYDELPPKEQVRADKYLGIEALEKINY